MSDLRLRVDGRDFSGWHSIGVVRGIESVSGRFHQTVFDRWGEGDAWPIAEEAACEVWLGDERVIAGYVDKRGISYGPSEHSLTVSGRDRTAALVDCSAALKNWEYLHTSLLALAKMLAEPFGISVRMQPKLLPPGLPEKLAIDPGDSAFEVLDKACRLCGVLPVSDGAGGLLLTRAGLARCATALVEGENILSASAQYDASGRYRRYLVTGQHPGLDGFAGDEAATVRGEAIDPAVKRASRVLMVRSESSITPELGKMRAQWEAKIRAARADAVTIRVPGWTQGSGALWPINARLPVRSRRLGIDGELLIAQATYSLDDRAGTTTELALRRPDAYLPEPAVPRAAWKELEGGV